MVSNIEPAVPVNYPDPELIAPEAESPMRYPSRNRKAVQKLDPSHNTRGSYDNAMIQYLCMSQVAEKEKQKRLSLHKGLRVWGDKGVAAVKAEPSQIHFRNVFTPVDPQQLSYKEKSEAFESHLFLEEKRNLDKKGRMVTGGNKQREYTPKQEASSPTSHTEAVFSTATIDALEGRSVGIIDLPNAFVQTDLIKNDKPVKIIMIIRGKLAELLCEITPDTYFQYAVRDRKDNMILYVKLLKALYGLMEASLMFY